MEKNILMACVSCLVAGLFLLVALKLGETVGSDLSCMECSRQCYPELWVER